MHKSQYKFAKKRNKWDVTIKSIKKPLMEKKVVNIKKIHQIRYKIGERERERELTFFSMNNLEGIWERGGNEVKRNL